MNITDVQRDHMRHALGLNQPGAFRPYRNRFWTYPGGDDAKDWEPLVEAGLAVRSRPHDWYGGMVCYAVTLAGLDMLGVKDRSGLDAIELIEGPRPVQAEGMSK